LRRGVAIFDNGVEREKCEFKIEVLCDLMEFAVDVRTSLLQKYPSEGCLKNFFALSLIVIMVKIYQKILIFPVFLLLRLNFIRE
jgi:hypothetical protein